MKQTLYALAFATIAAFLMVSCGKDKENPAAPAAAAPTPCPFLGYNGDAGNHWSAGYLSGCVYKSSGDFVARKVIVKTEAVAGNYRIGIYSDFAGDPNTMLRETGLLAKDTAAGWVTVAITPVTITANYRYWLMGISDVSMICNVQGTGHITKYYDLGVGAVQTPLPSSPGAGTILDGNNDIAILGCD